MDFSKAIDLFENYVNKYDLNSKGIKLKYNHTYRVVYYAEKIAESLNLSSRDVNIVKLTALFHDLSRFKQFMEYESFKDTSSFDHAEISVVELENNKILDMFNLTETEKEMIKDAIRFHSKLKLPAYIDEKTSLYSKILRDADKIDILEMFVLVADYTKVGRLSLGVENEMLASKSVSLKNVKTKIDANLLRIGFIFDLNFDYSFKRMLESGVIEVAFNKIIENAVDKDKIIEIKKHVDNYMSIKVEEVEC